MNSPDNGEAALRERIAVLESLVDGHGENTHGTFRRLGKRLDTLEHKLDELTSESIRRGAWGRGTVFGARTVFVALAVMLGAGAKEVVEFLVGK